MCERKCRVHSFVHAPSDLCLLNNHNVNAGYTCVSESTDFILNSLTFSWTNTHMLLHPLPIWQAFPWLPVDPKRQRVGREEECWGFVDHLWWLWAAFYSNSDCSIWSSVVRQRFHCGEQGGGLAFSGCYKICSLYKPPNPFFLSFCSSPHFDFLHHPDFPCGPFSLLGMDVWNEQYFVLRSGFFLNKKSLMHVGYYRLYRRCVLTKV